MERIGLQPLAAELAAIDAIGTSARVPGAFVRLAILGVRTLVLPVVTADADPPEGWRWPSVRADLARLAATVPRRARHPRRHSRAVRALRHDAAPRSPTIPAAAQAGSEVFQLEASGRARSDWRCSCRYRGDAQPHGFDSPERSFRVRLAPVATWIWRRSPRVIVNQVWYMEALAKLTASVPVARWKRLIKAALLDEYAPYLGKCVRGRRVRLPRRHAQWAQGQPAALGARRPCPRRVDGGMWSARLVERHSSPTRARMAGDRESAGRAR